MVASSSHRSAANDRCSVRRATPFDHDDLRSVLGAAAIAEVPILSEFDAADLLTEQVVFLAYVGSRPIGCIMAMPGQTTVLHGLFVLPDERGSGHGSELIRQAIAEFDAGGVARTYWTAVDPTLVGAHERFQKFGFSLVPELCEERLELMVRPSSIRLANGYPFPIGRTGAVPLIPKPPRSAAVALA